MSAPNARLQNNEKPQKRKSVVSTAVNLEASYTKLAFGTSQMPTIDKNPHHIAAPATVVLAST